MHICTWIQVYLVQLTWNRESDTSSLTDWNIGAVTDFRRNYWIHMFPTASSLNTHPSLHVFGLLRNENIKINVLILFTYIHSQFKLSMRLFKPYRESCSRFKIRVRSPFHISHTFSSYNHPVFSLCLFSSGVNKQEQSVKLKSPTNTCSRVTEETPEVTDLWTRTNTNSPLTSSELPTCI